MKDIDYVRILWEYLQYDMQLEKADIIIGFGSNDLAVAKRAVYLFQGGMAPYILFTGGLGKGTDGIWKKTEAETYLEIAIELGVVPEKIIIENKSTNTGENIRFSKRVLTEQGIKVKKAIIVHQPNMGRRIYAAVRKQWPEICPIIASVDCTLEQYIDELMGRGIDKEEIFSNIVGDFQRIDIFAKEGYQIEQEIPDKAQEAYDILCKCGYTKYVI